jgi:ethanolamine ammonia-lyase small subunit
MSEPTQPESSLASLRAHTPARIALARTGSSITTRDTLDFTLAHAQARDAVHAALSLPTLLAELHARNLSVLTVKSAAPDRATYIRRPDLGRVLSAAARTQLSASASSTKDTAPRLTLILADGLSALATDRHALPLLDALLPLLNVASGMQMVSECVDDNAANCVAKLDSRSLVPNQDSTPSADWQLTPIVLAEQARVALGDEIGQALGASLTLMLLGERPGLSAADSLGAYITWAPAPGRTDAQRNCVSNIRTGGLDPTAAAHRIAFYLHEARRQQLTGTALKDPDPTAPLLPPPKP